MKKIVFIMLHLGYGGVESAIINQANMLSDTFNVEIVSVYKLSYKIPFKINKSIKLTHLTNLEPNKKEFIESLKKMNIFKILKEGIKSIKILYLRKKVVNNYLNEIDADIVVSSRILFNKQISKCPQNIVKIAQEHVYHNGNKKYIKKLINSIKKLDYFMPVSQELTDFYKNKTNVKCKYIQHALDFDIPNYKYQYSKNLVAIGRLSKEKGFNDLIDIMAILNKKDSKIKLKIIGNGNEMDNLKNLVQSLNLSNNIDLLGFKNRNEINTILEDCSIYCMTSLEESFGLTVIETMALGLPCIAFDSAKGVLEIINSNNGIIIENRDKNKFANEIIHLLNNKELLKKMSVEAYNSAKKYDYKVIKSEWIDFYKKILK